MPEMMDRTCANKTCGKKFQARATDVRRGWGKFCSKRCKAQRQMVTHGNTRLNGHDIFDGAEDDISWDAHKEWTTGG